MNAREGKVWNSAEKVNFQLRCGFAKGFDA